MSDQSNINAALGAPDLSGSPDQVASQLYGYLAWALNIPEVGTILRQAASDAASGAQWSDAKLQGALQATDWWKTTDASARTFDQSMATDPATVNQQIAQKQGAIQKQLADEGVTVDPTRLQSIATDSLRYGWTAQQENAALDSELQRSPDLLASKVGESYKQMANDYAVPLSDATIQQWAAHGVSGVETDEQFREYLEAQAKSFLPAADVQNALSAGVTVAQYYDPYKQLAAQTLNVNPDSINLTDPKWLAAINTVDPKTGARVPMSLDQWGQYLKATPTFNWGQTQSAKDAAYSLVNNLKSTFGK